MPIPIPLICERCRAEGVAGEELFERYADLLDFELLCRAARAPMAGTPRCSAPSSPRSPPPARRARPRPRSARPSSASIS